ncbi:hypothetical protein [Kineococcus glutinatus]|uniref:DUF11 domain-containing protein n=1 Tax=Kineococcus glutinatus TaxID=1070872 RepID=A0ABP9I037_9ACTN
MRRDRAALTALALSAAVLAVAVPSPGAAVGQAVDGPRDVVVRHVVDVPGTDLASGRAIVLRVRHTPDPAEPHAVSLERTKVYVRRGDSGPVEVAALRRDGTVIDRWRAPDPLTTSAEQARDDEARYGVPYSPDLAVVTITDTRTGASTDVKTEGVVHAFCAAAPTDELCRRVDLAPHVWLGTPGPFTLRVGERLQVPVHVQLGNDGPDRAEVAGAVSVHGILDGVGFTTTDPTGLALPRFEPGHHWWTLTYELTCPVPGAGRVFVGATFQDESAEAVETDPADNAHNTWFDVRCDPAP